MSETGSESKPISTSIIDELETYCSSPVRFTASTPESFVASSLPRLFLSFALADSASFFSHAAFRESGGIRDCRWSCSSNGRESYCPRRDLHGGAWSWSWEEGASVSLPVAFSSFSLIPNLKSEFFRNTSSPSWVSELFRFVESRTLPFRHVPPF